MTDYNRVAHLLWFAAVDQVACEDSEEGDVVPDLETDPGLKSLSSKEKGMIRWETTKERLEAEEQNRFPPEQVSIFIPFICM